jgi:hypothetical protein
VLARLYGDDTEYSAGYTEHAFRKLKVGTLERDVDAALGSPLREVWIYEESGTEAVRIIFDEHGRVMNVSGSLRAAPTRVGESKEDVRIRMNQPTRRVLSYTRDRQGGSYRVRTIELERGVVVRIGHFYYVD